MKDKILNFLKSCIPYIVTFVIYVIIINIMVLYIPLFENAREGLGLIFGVLGFNKTVNIIKKMINK